MSCDAWEREYVGKLLSLLTLTTSVDKETPSRSAKHTYESDWVSCQGITLGTIPGSHPFLSGSLYNQLCFLANMK